MPKVLIVDDSMTVRQQVAAALGGAGFDVIEAVDGEDGLSQSQREPDVALVICDVNMPRMNGLELLAKLRESERTATLAVLMLTTEGQPEFVQRAKALGAKGWMVKPVRPSLLVAAVRKLTST